MKICIFITLTIENTPRGSKNTQKGSQCCPKGTPKTPKVTQRGPNRPQGSPKRPKWSPRGPQWVQKEPKRSPKGYPKVLQKGGPILGNLISSILMSVSHGITVLGTCLSKEREARLKYKRLPSKGWDLSVACPYLC